MKKVLFGMIVMAGSLMAQPPRGSFNWWESPLSQDINLSEDQRVKIRDTIREFRPKLIDMRASLEKAENDTEEALNDDSFDQKRASEAIERLVGARGQMTRLMSQMSIRLRATLTTEQWKELQRKRRTMGRQGPGMGPGQGPMDPQRRMDRRDMMRSKRSGAPAATQPGGPPPNQAPPPEE
jgi:Spy/CpxP family protein refolding chaperone